VELRRVKGKEKGCCEHGLPVCAASSGSRSWGKALPIGGGPIGRAGQKKGTKHSDGTTSTTGLENTYNREQEGGDHTYVLYI